ncbi:choice-of-anchor I family protein [Paenibacillus pasadenensis]|uniref:Alkaline phosphatase n=1 Tax=Paenibacillus pasadenensis TaxID=217090 RepID=A0A2N5ND92_9BACL|nr:choice-of-anchor I family protein [Paenibacillus pasadenensis]PLT48278.1 Alkaline phosphatase [Paenibacillus pasadenensis]
MNRKKRNWMRAAGLGLSLTTAAAGLVPAAGLGTAAAATEEQAAVAAVSATTSETMSQQVYADAFAMTKIGEYRVGMASEDGGVAEIVKYNRDNGRFYVVNGSATPPSLDIVELKAGTMQLQRKLDVKQLAEAEAGFAFGDLTSVDINVAAKRVFVAVQAAGANDAGRVLELDYEGNLVKAYPAGKQPDMVKSTPDGRYVLTADEGEPRGGAGTPDPEGSVTIVDRSTGTSRQIGFGDASVIDDRVHIRGAVDGSGQIVGKGPKSKAATDLEPEYIALSKDGKTAYVSLQENNAVAELDIEAGRFTAVRGLGLKDLRLPANALDLDGKDKQYKPVTADAYGVYMPDGIASYEAGGRMYLVTANEGDATEWPGMTNASKVKSLKDKLAPGSAAAAFFGATKAYDDVEAMSDWGTDAIYLYGGRSFSIWDAAELKQVYDSGNAFEAITASRLPDYFNASNTNKKFDSRSTKKGPEPEDVRIGHVGERTLAFTGLERIGGVMAYDVTSPAEARFVSYVNTRDFSESGGENAMNTDSAPEGLEFIAAADSPTGQPLLLVAHEVSGTVALLQLETTRVELARQELALTAGEAAVQLEAKAVPGAGAPTVTALTYSSSRPDIASVDAAGKVKPLQAGSAVIRVVSADGYGVAELSVTVKAAAEPSVSPTPTPSATPTPTPTPGGGGGGVVPTSSPSVSPSPTPSPAAVQVSVSGGVASGVLEQAAGTDGFAEFGAAGLEQALERLSAAGAARRELELRAAAGSADAAGLRLTADAAARLAAAGLERVTLSAAGLASAEWSGEAFAAAVRAAGGGAWSLEAKGGSGAVSVTVIAAGKELRGADAAAVRLSLPYAPSTVEAKRPEAIVALDAAGRPIIRSSYRDGRLILAGSGSGSYRIAFEAAAYGDTAGKYMEAPAAFLTARGIVQGTAAGVFSPQRTLTRADLAVMLSRLAGADSGAGAAAGGSGFADVPRGAYYAPAVAWAAAEGIAGGTGGGRFEPLAPVTREQLAVMLSRFAGSAGWELPSVGASAFADAASISPFAREAVDVLAGAGIVSGRPGADGQARFAPQASATRGEAAAMLAMFVQASFL